MGDQPADILDFLRGCAGLLEQRPGDRWAFLLLQRAIVEAVLALGFMDTDIVHERSGLQPRLCGVWQALGLADQPAERIDLEQVMDTARVAGIIAGD